MPPGVGVALAYLAGSMPTAFLAGRLLKGIDLRQHGSGNLGATNVYRVLGAKAGIAVFLIDVLKGALAVWLLPRLAVTPYPEWWAIAYGLAAVAGHVRPVFLLGRGGGKGVATATGVFLALAPVPTLLATVVWIAVLAASGYVSLASLSSAIALPSGVLVMEGVASPVSALAVVLALFVIWTHRANIGRLRRGEEARFGRRGAPVEAHTGRSVDVGGGGAPGDHR
ncbi:MAG TPA: glycerol-3-phosphate 1-O-acyltransferase PlsY [Gemmatimonadaceae bacterium]|nr:glycerol-3-phosphate 1-O-acyltransferase PlsY [Gemmatimonadaceae bacterium]